jgi:hypothetical protein
VVLKSVFEPGTPIDANRFARGRANRLKKGHRRLPAFVFTDRSTRDFTSPRLGQGVTAITTRHEFPAFSMRQMLHSRRFRITVTEL